MSQTQQELTTALLCHGRAELARLWHCTEPEVSKRLNGERNISLENFCAALDALDVRLVTDPDIVLVHRDEIQALNLLAQRYLERRNGGEGK
jgi:hypothetical protein